MTIDTQKLRQAAASVRAFLRPEYGREIARAADYIDALEAEIARMRADQAERDAEIRSLRHELASMQFRLRGVGMRQQTPIARVVLSGESNG